jgi:exopolysaccharide biosynthesis protein
MVLSLGPGVMERFQGVGPGAVLRIATASAPALLGARTALSGGPVLVRNGKQQKIRSSPEDPYELSSMLEQHPRTAFGWNKQWYFLVQVDGRQRDLSVGMTLDELSAWLVKLGCEEALNLDGGGSSSLWFDGRVRNNPCDGYERTIANSLVVVQKEGGAGAKRLWVKSPTGSPERSKGNEN